MPHLLVLIIDTIVYARRVATPLFTPPDIACYAAALMLRHAAAQVLDSLAFTPLQSRLYAACRLFCCRYERFSFTIYASAAQTARRCAP